MKYTAPNKKTATEAADPTVLGGRDISLRGGDLAVTASGDWATVSGRDAALQSVERETIANPGSFPRRQKWGRGIAALLFKPATRAVRDQAVSATLAGLKANRRITSVSDVSAKPAENGQGLTLTIAASTVDGPVTVDVVVKPPGVR